MDPQFKMAEGEQEKKRKSSLVSLYPHISPQKLSDLIEIEATEEQLEKADLKEKDTLDTQMSQNRLSSQRLTVMVIGTSGSGKSATGNTLLGKREFDIGCSAESITKEFSLKRNNLGLNVVDSPDSWNTRYQIQPPDRPVDFCIIVINIASPRFGKDELKRLRALQGADNKGIVSSGRCMAVLTHSDTTLRDVSLQQYLDKIQGDPLHEFLQGDMKGRVMAVNNNACTKYEQEETQKGLLLGIAQAMSAALVQKDAEKKTLMGKLAAIKDGLMRNLSTVPLSIRKLLDSSKSDLTAQQLL